MKRPKLITQTKTVIDHKRTGIAVRRYRESLGVTQACVAGCMGQSYQTLVSYLESGKRNWSEEKLDEVLGSIEKCSSIDKKISGSNK